MEEITVTPETAREVLKKLKPGSLVIFSPGRYGDVLELTLNNDLLHDVSDVAQTILRGEPGAIISMDKSAESFRIDGNKIAKEVQDAGGFPGLYPRMMDARIKLTNCANVTIEDLDFEKSWPSHISIEGCQDITIRNCTFTDATFAIAARGETTYGITVEGSKWEQDPVRNRIWREIPWFRIHGDQEDKHPPVNIEKDWRLFDGDFFRGFNIAGGVTIQHCKIGKAFNAIHLYNTNEKPQPRARPLRHLSLDINIHDCEFHEIRDNVLEPESGAFNWWFWNNEIKNSHKPFSIEIVAGGGFYIFSNLWWFDSIQGPDDDNSKPEEKDKNRTGGMFKFSKKSPRKKMTYSYVFQNSIATRSDYARKGLFYGLQHFNNAVWCIREGIGFDKYILKEDDQWKLPNFFGDLTIDDDDPEFLGKRFTMDWKKLRIRFEGDVIYDHAWPEKLRDKGYDRIENSIAKDPLFQDFLVSDDLTLKPGSPCLGNSKFQVIKMPLGDDWELRAGQDIGAYQGEELTPGPQFKPVIDRDLLREQLRTMASRGGRITKKDFISLIKKFLRKVNKAPEKYHLSRDNLQDWTV